MKVWLVLPNLKLSSFLIQDHTSEKYLYNTKVWVLDCVDYRSTIKHSGLERVFQWAEKYSPEKVYLTNMSHNIDYHEIITKLPSHIKPLYDGFKIKL